MRGDAQCICLAGEAYAIYGPSGGSFEVNVATGGRKLAARWFNPREGGFKDPTNVSDGWNTFRTPDSSDWALVIKA